MQQRGIDIVQTTLLWADLIGSLAAKLAGVPAVFSWETVSHEGDPFHNNFQRRAGYRLAMRGVDRIIPVSQEIKRSLMRRRGIPERKIQVIPYGVDLEKYRPGDHQAALQKRQELGISVEAILIGVFARLEPPKGHRFFVEAFPAIVEQYPRVRAIFAGEGSLRADLEAAVRTQGMSNYLMFLGARNDVNELLGAIDLVVLPSVSEGLPNVVLEAMAAQKPVVATAVGGIPEVVRHGENGYLVPPADASALQNIILQCLSERERWPYLARQGRRTVETEFSLAHQVASFERIFADVYDAKTRLAQSRLTAHLT
jgi:glycosyltransferase involved in cell wall biosynthesis